MFRILESQAPAKQTAEDTISTLSGRLQSATLLEDRRAAILGLRSFAKLYPASVASGGLRNLINSLSTDGEDVDTTKVVLETLLMLFNPDESSPEASDDIALWLADEFTQRQENITVLLDLLDRTDFFSRLYSLQLISAISTARPERTQECVYTAPLGVSRLVAVLDDKREAIRSEGLLLLVSLTPASSDLQKLVAFENAFDRIFSIIDAEGSLSHGGVVVQDCLSLLANLLALNVSNQSFFRETGGFSKIAATLRNALQEEDSADGVPEWATSQRDKNLWGFLSIIRLFLNGGSVGTQMNQSSFWQQGIVSQVLEIGFKPSLSNAIRSEALSTCADLIRANTNLQEKFAQRDISMHLETPTPPATNGSKVNGHHKPSTTVNINVIQGLLDFALAVSSQEGLDIRLAASECLKAYLYGHGPIRQFFLQRARTGHLASEPELDNIFTILLNVDDGRSIVDPYRQWIAAVILFHLLYEDYDAKKAAMEIVEGDASQGEEEVTCIQALAGNLISNGQKGSDERVTVAYLMILSGWLYEDPDAVNDFLQEGSNVQSLIQLVLQPNHQRALEAGLCAFLLGIIYEFSSKDSPIPRATLHEILTTRLGRDQFNDKMTKLREHPFVRDFEVLPQGTSSDQFGGLPDVYFDKLFVDFLKDNFSRVSRAIDREPGIEVSVVANGVQKGISRELVDSLKAQVEEKNHSLQKAESEALTLQRKLGQEQADHRKTKESTAIELGRIKLINESLQRDHEEDSRRQDEAHRQALVTARSSEEKAVSTLEARMNGIREEHESTSAKTRARYQAELDELSATVQRLEKDLEKSSKDHAQDLQTAHEEYTANGTKLEARLKRALENATEAEERAEKAEKAMQEKEEARAAAQTELDDLFIVLGDIEEKRARDKKSLKALGEEVSDGEDEDEDASDAESQDEKSPAGGDDDID